MALFHAYFDDSQSDGEVWAISGLAGYQNQWDHLEHLWNEVLVKHGVPYFHMREMGDPKGVFAKWHPPKDHQEDVAAFFIDLIEAINKCHMRMFSSACWLRDLERFNREMHLALEPYPLAAFACMAQLGIQYDGKPVTAVFDRADKVEAMLAKARVYADSDSIFPGACDAVAATPLPPKMSYRNVPAIQVADLAVWEVRKAHFNMREWKAHPERPALNRKGQWDHYLEWTKANKGSDPAFRKSLMAILDSTTPSAVAWDYDQLIDTHEARGGVWA